MLVFFLWVLKRDNNGTRLDMYVCVSLVNESSCFKQLDPWKFTVHLEDGESLRGY